MIINLLGGTYESEYKDWNSERTINWYPAVPIEASAEKGKTPMVLLPRPGLKEFVDLSGTSVRGLYVARTLTERRCFAVVGQTLYELGQDKSATNRGTLSDMKEVHSAKVHMAVNGNSELMIQSPTAGYVFNLTTNTLTKISDADYPGGATLTYTDGYFIISDNDGRASFSNLNAGTSWDAADVFTPAFKADATIAVAAIREEIYCFGREVIEVYLNDGETPFTRVPRASIYYGLAARHTVVPWHGGVFFLGGSESGGKEAYLIETDYTPRQISKPPGISRRINQGDNSNAEAYLQYSKDGHILYVLHLPDSHTTLVYDATIDMWHERQSVKPVAEVDGQKSDDMFRGRLFVEFAGRYLYGDWYSGKILEEDRTLATDDGLIRRLRRTSPIFNNEQKYISVYELELDFSSGFGTTTGQGSDPVLMFRYSVDGGNTFEPEQFIKLGKLGEYDYRVMINKLGTARNWAVDMQITDPVNVALMQARASGSFSAW